ncbi:hypothetical protein COLO4_35549 [Corchorus olitorius]|uniref:Uncharacterized protein n=1 Tax=Corchorus olitorius TaxID=93759 RepID=A0A1R3GFJ5_9ROSI|nr:hypothetical protein COLO4_35549 [Corchorus olitorius]
MGNLVMNQELFISGMKPEDNGQLDPTFASRARS